MLAVTFLQLRGIDLQAQLLRNTLDAYSQTLQLTQIRLKGGLTRRSMCPGPAQLEETRAQLVDLGVERAQDEHAIAVLVGELATGFHIAEKPLVGIRRRCRRACRPNCWNAGRTSLPRSAGLQRRMR